MSTAKKQINFAVIGCGLMGKEFASGAARWFHLDGLEFAPKLIACCDLNAASRKWFEDNVSSIEQSTDDYTEILNNDKVDAVYCAVPHNLHEKIYCDIIKAGKHLLGEKPFGIDLAQNQAILACINDHPSVHVSCSSEFPFFPGALMISQWLREQNFGEIFDISAGFWHSSDLNPKKAINWKRMIDINGEYGCMGDLGMHVVHFPFRHGFIPERVNAQLVNIIRERPDGKGGVVPCETWDNALLSTSVINQSGEPIPMSLSIKRIAPGHANTWYIRIDGTKMSAEFSTKNPKQVRWMPYEPGGQQAWMELDTPHQSAYKSITGGIFEFGFSDSLMQMFAAFCDELTNGHEGMSQPFHCATPEEAAMSHMLFTASLKSHKDRSNEALLLK